ncbi:hypothetical protein EV182_007893, partial [Spiromyces aspiralis]
ANAIGNKGDDIREFLESEYETALENVPESIEDTKAAFIELAIKALDKGAHSENIDIIAVYAKDGKPVIEHIDAEAIKQCVEKVNLEKKELEEKNKQSRTV